MAERPSVQGAAPIEKYLELVEAGGIGVGALGYAGEIILVRHVEQGALEAEARVLLERGLKLNGGLKSYPRCRSSVRKVRSRMVSRVKLA